jgi:exonuclease SbcC
VTELTARAAQAEQELRRAVESLADRARLAPWMGLATPAAGRDERDVLESLQAQLQRQATALAGTVARLRSEAGTLEKAVARSEALAARRASLESEAALAGMLAQHLQANQFVAYVQEEALRVLADDGSRRLRSLSQGRYSLECEAQEFCVVDHWNADMKRSVKTLSGGETFLASLALALALAESLAELSSEGRAGDALESLFLDEGFGTLDQETLGLVVQAIEALQGGHRMVGVVTHMQELAEQLPARLLVGRTGEGASLTVV